MSGYSGYKYSIDFDYIKSKSEQEIESHYMGTLYVYSDMEIPTERLHEIIDEVEKTLPKGLTADKFKENIYHVLEEKGLRRFEDVKDHGIIGKIKYEQREMPVPEK